MLHGINPLQHAGSLVADTTNALQPPNNNVNYEQLGSLLKSAPSRWVIPDIQNYSILGNPYSYYQYRDPAVQNQVKAFEDKIGNFENMMPLSAVGLFTAASALRPITKHIPILSTLGSPAIAPFLGMGASWLMANNAKEDKKRYIANKIRDIQGPTGPIEQELTNLNLYTQDLKTGERLAFDDVKKAFGDSLQQSLLRLKQQGLNSSKAITDIPARMYEQAEGSRIFSESNNANHYRNFSLPNSANDAVSREQMTYLVQNGILDGRVLQAIPNNPDERKAEFMKLIIKKAGFKPASTQGGINGFINNQKNLEIYKNALNLFKSQHSIANGLFNSIQFYIDKQARGLEGRMQQGGIYKTGARTMFRESVRNQVIQNIADTFPNYPEIQHITESMLARKWQQLEGQYREQLL